jgi:hypothetical protein
MAMVFSKKVVALLSLLGLASLIITTFVILYRLDVLVNVDLYHYGLMEGPWLVDYWAYVRLSLALICFAVLVNVVGLIYVSSRKPAIFRPFKVLYVAVRGRLRLEQKVSLALLGVGIGLMVVSVYYSLSLISFVSLGLIFWGALFLYVRSEKYVKEQLLQKTAFSPLRILDDALAEIGNLIVANYVPPRFLEESQSDRIFIFLKDKPSKENGKERKHSAETTAEMDFEPPGSQLAQFFEKTMGVDFAKITLQNFNQRIPKALVEELEIAQEVYIGVENDALSIRLVGSPFASICSDASNLKKVHNSIGCPICSAFACALAKTTRKFVVIKSEQPNREKRIINTEYLLSDSPIV